MSSNATSPSAVAPAGTQAKKMPFPWLKPPRLRSPPPPPPTPHGHLPPTSVELHPFFLAIHGHLASFLSDACSLKSHLDSTVQTLATRARHALQSGPLRPDVLSPVSALAAPWARISPHGAGLRRLPTTTDAFEERLSGIPVYALSNSAEEFVLVSATRTGKNLGLFCFRKEDADALLEQMRAMNKDMRQGSKVVAVALNKVSQLKVDGISFRFVPDSSQVANAITVMENLGDPIDDFPGVPVFQSRSLVLKSEGKKYRPAFFRKEDLEDSLFRAAQQQRKLNPALRKGDIQVSVLEDIISDMKENSTTKWDNIVFIPPGFNVATMAAETEET